MRRPTARWIRRFLWWVGKDDPERAHDLLITTLELAGKSSVGLALVRLSVAQPRLGPGREIMGLRFRSPIGLAAGFDKNGRALPALAQMGFGFIEAGGVTPAAQPGNPTPRITRFAGGAIINSLGFPSVGVEVVANAQEHSPKVSVPVGWNLAKNRDTPLELAGADFIKIMRRLWSHADYISLNISSPNTPNLRLLEQAEALDGLLAEVIAERTRLAEARGYRPILVKISPDLEPRRLDEIIAVALDRGVDGVIATNTTTRRDGLSGADDVRGGMSGAPLHRRAVETVAQIAARSNGQLVVVGVGGIMSAADAVRMMSAGADLIQICTGFIFRGPELIDDINCAVSGWW